MGAVLPSAPGLLEKLAQASVASFDDADLHQIFQAYLLLDQQSESVQLQPPPRSTFLNQPRSSCMSACNMCRTRAVLLWPSHDTLRNPSSTGWPDGVAAAKRAGAVAPAGAFPHALLE